MKQVLILNITRMGDFEEAVLQAVHDVGVETGTPNLPITMAFTSAYPGRSQTENYTTLKDRVLGAMMCLDDIEALAGPHSPFRDLRVMVHLDHGQPEEDATLLEEHVDRFSCVMFDASALPFEENIARTAAYVERFRDRVTIEGAVDEIVDASGTHKNELCTVERAQRFVEETGVDLIVPNLGTEHRSTAEQAHYHVLMLLRKNKLQKP